METVNKVWSRPNIVKKFQRGKQKSEPEIKWLLSNTVSLYIVTSLGFVVVVVVVVLLARYVQRIIILLCLGLST